MTVWRGPHERRDPAEASEFGVVLAGLLLVLVVGVWLAGWVVAETTGTGHGSAVQWTRAWFDSRPAWSATATLVTFGVLGVMLVLLGMLVRRFDLIDRYRGWKTTHRVDRKARMLSAPEDEQQLRRKACTRLADRVSIPAEFPPGLMLGRSVAHRHVLYVGYEHTCLVIKGPRQGKTTSLVVPMVVGHPGPVLECSNKRELHDLTRGPRSGLGVVWTLDMQQIAQQPPTWWWNPLSFILEGEDKASRAARLAGAWQSCHASPTSTTDAYFGPGGESLLANLLLAAALGGLPTDAALKWLGDLRAHEVDLPDPVTVLREHGYEVAATELADDRELTPRQLDGLTGTARGILSFLREEQFAAWITPDTERREFKPAEFVQSTDTLTLLSKNTKGPSGRAIVTALTMAVTEAGLQHAQRSRGGRLQRPLLLMLDEAANICPWPELPDLYSFLGSHGIIPVTILQNKAQGVKAWGKDGMDQLTSSANVMVIGGGINDSGHLRDLVELIGERARLATSKNRGVTWRSRSTGSQIHKEQIFTTADLRAWPAGRAVVFAPSSRPILVRMVPWTAGAHAKQISASEEFYGPGQDTETEAIAA